MSAFKRLLLLTLIMIGSMLYKKVDEHWGALPAPKLNPNEWWGDGPAPKDYQAYLANSSEVISNRLSYSDNVSKRNLTEKTFMSGCNIAFRPSMICAHN